MKLQKASIGLVAMGFLASCAADGSAGREGSPIWFMRTTPAERSQYFTSVCTGYGFQPNTPQMAQCVQTESLTARDSMKDSLGSIQSNSQTTTTNCNRSGNSVNCTSNTW
jgi:hypothetical protein